MHFPGSHLRLMLSVILPFEARTFLTVIPFGVIPRGRPAKLHTLLYHFFGVCQAPAVLLFFLVTEVAAKETMSIIAATVLTMMTGVHATSPR